MARFAATMSRLAETSKTSVLSSVQTSTLQFTPSGIEVQCLSAFQPLLSESELAKSDKSSALSTYFSQHY
jgi:hypothetical protein